MLNKCIIFSNSKIIVSIIVVSILTKIILTMILSIIKPYLQGLQRPLLCHQPKRRHASPTSLPQNSRAGTANHPSPPLPPAAPWGPPRTTPPPPAQTGRTADVSAANRPALTTAPTPNSPLLPPATPPGKFCSPCLERLLQAKDSVVSGRRVQVGEGEGGSRGRVSHQLLYLQHVQRRHRR